MMNAIPVAITTPPMTPTSTPMRRPLREPARTSRSTRLPAGRMNDFESGTSPPGNPAKRYSPLPSARTSHGVLQSPTQPDGVFWTSTPDAPVTWSVTSSARELAATRHTAAKIFSLISEPLVLHRRITVLRARAQVREVVDARDVRLDEVSGRME